MADTDQELEAQLADLAARGDSDRAFELGNHYKHEVGDLEAAERCFLVAIEAGDLHAPNNLAGVYRRQERWTEAEAMFRRGIDGGDAKASLNLGRMLRERGRDDEGRRLIEDAAAAGDADAMEALARVHYGARDNAEAEWWFRLAVEADPEPRPAAVTCVGIILDERERDEEAIEWLERGAALGDPHAPFHLGKIARRRGDADAARAWFERGAEAGDEDALRALGHGG